MYVAHSDHTNNEINSYLIWCKIGLTVAHLSIKFYNGPRRFVRYLVAVLTHPPHFSAKNKSSKKVIFKQNTWGSITIHPNTQMGKAIIRYLLCIIDIRSINSYFFYQFLSCFYASIILLSLYLRFSGYQSLMGKAAETETIMGRITCSAIHPTKHMVKLFLDTNITFIICR